MWPLAQGLVTGGASLLGSMFSSQTSAQNTQEQLQAQEAMQAQSEQFNAQQAQLNRDYQTQMSSTAYQRASADMKAAGLNPAMMFSSGSAASSPGGSTASVGTPSVPTPQRTNPFAGLGDAVSKVASTAIQAKTFDKLTEEIANLQVEQSRGRAETNLAQSREALTLQQMGTESAETQRRRAEAEKAALDIPGRQVEATRAKAFMKMPQWLQDLTVQGSTVGRAVSDATAPLFSTARAVRSFSPVRTQRDEQGWRNPETGEWSRQSFEQRQ